MGNLWTECEGFTYLNLGDLPPVSIEQLYLFYDQDSANKYLANVPLITLRGVVIISVGNLPDATIIAFIQLNFSNALFRAAFGNDLSAIVLACRISLWLKGTDASFALHGTNLLFHYKGRKFTCPVATFSLSRFCRISGFRTSLKSIKLH